MSKWRNRSYSKSSNRPGARGWLSLPLSIHNEGFKLRVRTPVKKTIKSMQAYSCGMRKRPITLASVSILNKPELDND
jgi:hypothetical protein